jgi:tol-pal system protein YbgF
VRRIGSQALLVCGAALVLGGCVSGRDIDDLSSKLGDIEHDVVELQRVASTKEGVSDLEQAINQSLSRMLKVEADMNLALEQLSAQIDQLEANLEDTNYRLSQLSQQIAATNQELKSFRTSTFVRGEVDAGGQPPAEVSLPSDPQALYQTAYNDYLRGAYELSIMGFRQYLESFPNTELADNATYWIGESYFSQGQYQQAIREFDNIVNNYPRSDKVASALLKKAYSYLELGDIARGRAQLRSVITEYPSTDEANLARQRLAEIG